MSQSQQYYANQQTQARSRKQRQAVISGAANNGGGLIRITALNHRFTGPPNKVDISGVNGTTEANALNWVIAVIDGNTFDLVGSTFTNAYISGGLAKEQ
jgi:hypothetical protein